MGILRRNWKKLAEPMRKFDEEIVREFYANAWAERQERDRRKMMVRGKWISYSPQAIDDFLGILFPTRMKNVIIRSYVQGERGSVIGR